MNTKYNKTVVTIIIPAIAVIIVAGFGLYGIEISTEIAAGIAAGLITLFVYAVPNKGTFYNSPPPKEDYPVHTMDK